MAGPINEHASALAQEWKRLTRAATFVAMLTAPAFFFVLFDTEHFSLLAALIVTVAAVIVFRGLVEVVTRKLIPSPSLYGADQSLKEQDIVDRRRYWFWRGKFRRLPVYALVVLGLLALCQLLFSFSGVSSPFFDPFTGLRKIFPPDTLPQLALVFIQLPLLFFVNFAIFFGPFLFFAVRQIRGYEPGDASWGVKIDDVRGQAEAKEEITRVITLWQSGEEFEKAGGKRERGLLFLGAPGTGKTMISKAIATNFNCPFVTIPGSGFAGMFIGMDAITVQFLARKARKLASKWGGQCIVFIDEIDAVGMRRQALQGGMGMGMGMGANPVGTEPSSIHDFCFFGPSGSLTSSGDLIIESRAWRERLFAAARRDAQPRLRDVHGPRHGAHPAPLPRLRHGRRDGRRDGAQPAADRDGRDRRAAAHAQGAHQPPQHLPGRDVRHPPPARQAAPAPAPAQAALRSRSTSSGPATSPSTCLTRRSPGPGRMGRHIWFRTPTKDDRLDILDLYLAKVDHEPDLDTDRRRDELARITNGYSPSMIEQCCSMALTIAHTEGRRAFAWEDIVEAMTTVETGTAQNIEYIQEETRAVAIHEAGHAAAGHIFLEKDVLSTRLSIRKRGGSLGHYQSMEKDERFSHFRGRVMGQLVMTLGAMAAEHVFYGENSQGVGGDVPVGDRHRRGDGRHVGDGPRPGAHSRQPGARRRARGGAQAPGADRLDDHEPRRQPGPVRRQPGRRRAGQPRQEAGRGADPRSGLHHRLCADGRQPRGPGEDRRRARRTQGDLRRRGGRPAGLASG